MASMAMSKKKSTKITLGFESAIENWTRGAIGSALSHIKAWRRCIELDQEVLIAEDDVILLEIYEAN